MNLDPADQPELECECWHVEPGYSIVDPDCPEHGHLLFPPAPEEVPA